MCVYLLSEQSTGQKATAVAESPTSRIEEHGLISGGSTESPESSNLHGPHTITWTHTHTKITCVSNQKIKLILATKMHSLHYHPNQFSYHHLITLKA